MTERQQARLRTVLVVLFVTYLVLLTWLVLWKLHVPFVGRAEMREVKLVPFVATSRFGHSAPFEVAGNAAVFLPFGIYLGLLAPKWSWWKVVAVVGSASLAFEVAQYVLAAGSSDVTDVIVNTAGGLAGFGLLALVRRALRSHTTVVTTWLLAFATVVALSAIVLFVASFPHIPPLNQGGVTIIN